MKTATVSITKIPPPYLFLLRWLCSLLGALHNCADELLRVAEAGEELSEACKSYKEGRLPLRERGPNFAAKLEAFRAALRAWREKEGRL